MMQLSSCSQATTKTASKPGSNAHEDRLSPVQQCLTASCCADAERTLHCSHSCFSKHSMCSRPLDQKRSMDHWHWLLLNSAILAAQPRRACTGADANLSNRDPRLLQPDSAVTGTGGDHLRRLTVPLDGPDGAALYAQPVRQPTGGDDPSLAPDSALVTPHTQACCGMTPANTATQAPVAPSACSNLDRW